MYRTIPSADCRVSCDAVKLTDQLANSSGAIRVAHCALRGLLAMIFGAVCIVAAEVSDLSEKFKATKRIDID